MKSNRNFSIRIINNSNRQISPAINIKSKADGSCIWFKNEPCVMCDYSLWRYWYQGIYEDLHWSNTIIDFLRRRHKNLTQNKSIYNKSLRGHRLNPRRGQEEARHTINVNNRQGKKSRVSDINWFIVESPNYSEMLKILPLTNFRHIYN